MSATAARPRVGGAFVVSAVLHALALGALAATRGPAPRPAPPVYRVDLVAAPPGPARLGEAAPGAAAAPNALPNAPPAVATPVAPAPARPSPTAPAPPRPTPPRPAGPAPASPKAAPPRSVPHPRPAPPPRPSAAPHSPAAPVAAAPGRAPVRASRPSARPPATASTPTQAPRAAASPERRPGAASPTRTGAGEVPTTRPPASAPAGGTGRDPTTVRTPGLNFPYPGYLANIARQVDLRFDPGARRLEADVAFLIHRDGSVTDIRVVRSSGSYAFDLEARGAVEAAGVARAFGPLPGGFRDDVLPVTFSFDPRGLR